MTAVDFPNSQAFLEDLQWRGLIAQSTDLAALRTEMDRGPITLYCGFDPTAISLHVGSLVGVLLLRRFQLAGHRVLGLVGGATGLIGDPKMTGERVLNPAETVAEWSESLRRQLGQVLDLDGPNPAQLVNNYDWTQNLSTIDFLREIGKHFPVNRMLDREAVARRLATDGISYTEFSYVLLQSMDYLELFKRHNCRLQTGGSDQYGNIVAGVDLVRRVTGESVHALTTPLVTKADGTKFGKTESGAIWLDASLTSPYAFYQWCLNTDDRDILSLLRYYSLRPRAEIEDLAAATAENPQRRAAQRAFAQELTALLHGDEAVAAAEAASQALFGGGDLYAIDAGTLGAALSETNHLQRPLDGETTVVELLVATALASSNGAARRLIGEGGVYLNNARVSDPAATVDPQTALNGGWFVLRRGKKSYAAVQAITS